MNHWVMQVKTTMRYTSHLLEWLSSKRKKVVSVGEDVEKKEPLCTVGGIVNWCNQPLWKTVWRFLKKLNVELQSINLTYGYLSEENKNTNSKL